MSGLRLEEGEAISFEAFMSDALHHPQRGYYARRIATVGRGGDFTTTAEIAPCLARAMAHWVVNMARMTGCRDVIELGPGSGKLAAAIMQELPWWWRLRLRWHLVEKSEPLREKQRKLLGKRVFWHQEVKEVLLQCRGSALIYSNEFFDAFPVRVFRRYQQSWQELYLIQKNQRTEEIWRPLEEKPPSSIWGREWADEQRVEVHDSVRQWLLQFSGNWHRGAMLTIDYGADCAGLYHRQRRGSLRAYWQQHCIVGDGIYLHPGQKDLTADVNFTDLCDWSGFGTHQLFSQREFLLPWVDQAHAGDRCAADDMGAGSAFTVWQWLR